MLQQYAASVTKLVQNFTALQKWENSLLDKMISGLNLKDK